MNDLSETYGVFVADEIELVNWMTHILSRFPRPRLRNAYATGSAPSPRRMQTPPVAWTDGAHSASARKPITIRFSFSREVAGMGAPGTRSASILQTASAS